MTVAAKRLNIGNRPALIRHFVALPDEDLRLRFGIPMSEHALREYVGRIDFDRDAIFGVFEDNLSLSGVAHVAIGGGMAEFGVSVLPDHRKRGIGGTLFEHAHAYARNHFIRTMFMHCLTENRVMMHIAKKSGMTICTESGEADAYLKLPPLDAATIAAELFNERVALFDYALKSQMDVARRLNAAAHGSLGEDGKSA
jgi:GNAT superfamily N-acetyltransferase